MRLLEIMQQVAELLEKTEDKTRFALLHQQRKAFFNRTYVDSATGKTITSSVQTGFFRPPSINPTHAGQLIDTQVSYAIPIAFNVFDDKNLAQAKQHLAAAVSRSNSDDTGTTRPPYSLMTGFIGTASLNEALSLAGRDDLAYRLLQQTSYPSWLYSVVNGATTIWERLNSYTQENGFGGNNSMNSFNHYSFGAVGSWMMGRSLGIRRSNGKSGFQQFDLAPTPDPTGKMTWAKGHYDSLYGRIKSSWRVQGDHIMYQFTVPENTQATLHLPAQATATVVGPEINFQQVAERRVYSLTPGDYQFKVTD